MAAQEAVIMATSSAATDEKVVDMTTFPFQSVYFEK